MKDLAQDALSLIRVGRVILNAFFYSIQILEDHLPRLHLLALRHRYPARQVVRPVRSHLASLGFKYWISVSTEHIDPVLIPEYYLII